MRYTEGPEITINEVFEWQTAGGDYAARVDEQTNAIMGALEELIPRFASERNLHFRFVFNSWEQPPETILATFSALPREIFRQIQASLATAPGEFFFRVSGQAARDNLGGLTAAMGEIARADLEGQSRLAPDPDRTTEPNPLELDEDLAWYFGFRDLD